MEAARCLAGLGLTVSLAISSCSTLSPPSQPKVADSHSHTASPPELEGWQLIDNDPPTYLPEGIPADTRTDIGHGDWVLGGEDGAKWFIPRRGARGLSHEELFDEAAKMRSRKAKSELAVRKVADVSGKIGLTAAILPLGMGGADVTPLVEDVWTH